MTFYGMTDIGRKRENNEDNFEIFKVADNATLLLVCDGMGGEAGGAEASALAIESFISELREQTSGKTVGGKLVLDDPEIDVPMILDNAVYNANFEVWQKSQDVPELHGMGTTLVGAFIMTDPLCVWSVNVGDSRMYLMDEEKIGQMTVDHSYVQHLVDTGVITPAEAEKRTDKNIITRAIGISVQAEPDIKPIGAVDGEIILLCSDGLSGMLTADEIHGVAARPGATAEEKVRKLVSLANDAGGDDNITVVIAEL